MLLPMELGRVFQLALGGIGLVGNFLCLVVLLRKSLRNYTNLLIVTQTIADLVASLFLIIVACFRIAGYGQTRQIGSDLYGPFYCFFVYSYLPVFAFFAISTYNLTVISIERYLAVLKPMWYIAQFKRKRLYVLTAVAWLIAPLLQIALSLDVKYNNGYCVDVNLVKSYVGGVVFLWEYFAPAFVMVFSFACVAQKLRKLNRISVAWLRENDNVVIHREISTSSSHSRRCDRRGTRIPPHGRLKTDQHTTLPQPGNTRRPPYRDLSANPRSPSPPSPFPPTSPLVTNDQHVPGVIRPAVIRRQKTTKTLLVIVLVFMVCWSPNQWAFFYYNLGGHLKIDGNFHLVSIILATCNTCVNPFILAFRYKVYQRGLVDLLRGSFRR